MGLCLPFIILVDMVIAIGFVTVNIQCDDRDFVYLFLQLDFSIITLSFYYL